MSWRDRYRAELARQQADEAASAQKEVREHEQLRADSDVVSALLRQIEQEVIATFLRTANTPTARSIGNPVTHPQKGLFGKKKASIRWDMIPTNRSFMGGQDRLFVASDSTWGYFIDDSYADQSGRTSNFIGIGRDQDGWYCAYPPYGRPVGVEDVTRFLIEGLGRLRDRFGRRLPGLVPSDLRSAAGMILSRVEEIVIEFMARNRIEPL